MPSLLRFLRIALLFTPGLLHADPGPLPLRSGIPDPALPTPTPPPGLTLEVSPQGHDNGDGSASAPFPNLESCRDFIRHLRQQNNIPAGGIRVLLHGGIYLITQPLALTSEDSGTDTAPIIFTAAPGESPIFSGGTELKLWHPYRDSDNYPILPASARPYLLVADLPDNGIPSVLPLDLGGYASASGFTTHPLNELFCDGQAMPLSRDPDKGWIHAAARPDPATPNSLPYTEQIPATWSQEPDLILYGYWFWSWADAYLRPASFDLEHHLISMASQAPRYGYGKKGKFYALNALSGLNAPGKWVLDHKHLKLLFYPPSISGNHKVELSLLTKPMVEAADLHDVAFEGLTWDLGSADAVHLENCHHVTLAGCTISRFAGNGLEISGDHNLVLSCHIYSLGRGGIVLYGGNRQTLSPADEAVINCDIHELSRIDHTYTPAILANGVGIHLAHNRLHDIPSSALRIEGNDHLVEDNEVYNVAYESDDQGGSDTWGDATYRGNIFRANYWHHIGDWKKIPPLPTVGHAGIRLDDAISGTLIVNNIFEQCSDANFGGVQINGGQDNRIENNLFLDCEKAMSVNAWKEDHWKTIASKNLKKIDASLYATKYPGLKDLLTYTGTNTARRNATVRCHHLFSPEAKASLFLSIDNQPNILSDYHLHDLDKDIALPGLDPIPLSAIGLYQDAWLTLTHSAQAPPSR